MADDYGPPREKQGRYRVLLKDDLLRLIEGLMRKQPAMGPTQRPDQPGFYSFDWLKDPEEFVPHYTTTTLPPKKAFFPPDETLFHFDLDSPPKFEVSREQSPFALIGVHPCDLAALEAIDIAYRRAPPEMLWHENRKRAVILGMDCMPDEYCFCTSVDTCEARFPCDLFLTGIQEGYLTEIFTPQGEQALAGTRNRDARSGDLEEAEEKRRQKREAVSSRFNTTVPHLAHILEKGVFTRIWKEIAERCYSCGSCNITCPTCFCFEVHDAFDFNLRSGIRHRTWDSCQLLEFALIAGGENMRKERWQRVRHRWHRKFLYLYREFGRPYCTGCGRCGRACTADINLVDVTNRIIDEAGEEVQE